MAVATGVTHTAAVDIRLRRVSNAVFTGCCDAEVFDADRTEAIVVGDACEPVGAGTTLGRSAIHIGFIAIFHQVGAGGRHAEIVFAHQAEAVGR